MRKSLVENKLKIVSLFMLIFAVINSHASPLQVVKTLYIGGDSLGVNITNALSTTDGGIVFVGSVDTGGRGQIPPTRHSGTELLVGKVDSNQRVSWLKTYGSSGDDIGYSIVSCHSADGGYAILGSSGASDGDVGVGYGALDYWLLRVDKDGNKLWSKCFGSNGNDYASSIVESSDNGFVLAGSTSTSSASDDVSSRYEYSEFSGDWLLIKVDSQGNRQWTKILGGTGDESNNGILISSSNGYYFASTSNSNDHECTDMSWHSGLNIPDPLIWLIKLDLAGNVEWVKSYGASVATFLYCAVLDPRDSTLVLGGTTHGNDFMAQGNHNFGSYLPEDILVIKVDVNGNVVWHRMLGTEWDESLAGNTQGIIINPNSSGYLIYGKTTASANPAPPPPSGVTGYSAFWLSTIDSNGLQVDNKVFGGMEMPEYPKSLVNFRGGVAAIGTTFARSFTEGINTPRSSPGAGKDGFISYIKYSTTGMPTVSGIVNDLIISPNPSRGLIHVTINDTKRGILTIANLSGQVLLTTEVSITPNIIDIQTSSWSKGTYLINWINEKNLQANSKFVIK